MKQTRQYGTWDSPLTPRSLSGMMRLRDVQWDGDTLVWLEGHGKQSVLVMQRPGEAARELTEDNSARGRIGYGGGDFTAGSGHVFFIGNKGRLYRQNLEGGLPKPITPAFGDAAAPRLSADGTWVVYVHSYEWVDGLALVDAAGETFPRKFAFGADFVMQPAWSPAGDKLAYIAWDMPQMPWVGTELRLATVVYGDAPAAGEITTLVGSAKTSVFQPEFSPDGRYLSYVSDASGWWHLYLYDLESGDHTQLTNGEVEYGLPGWVQGIRTYGWGHNSRVIYALANQRGFNSVQRIDIRERTAARITDLDDYTAMSQIAVSPTRDAIALIAANSTTPARIVTWSPAPPDIPAVLADADQPTLKIPAEYGEGLVVVKRSSSENLTDAQLSTAAAIEWEGHDGATAHGLFYAPHSDKFEGMDKPPLIVSVHGGPTSQRMANYDNEVQFFTTRGFAVLQVNHRGSTGYGRAYMLHHAGNWGVYDVQDSITGAQHLAHHGLVDGDKLVIMGGSAGGYTVLQALVDKPGFFKAGVCSYGISNQFTLIMDTEWKFESRYSDWLLGALPDAADKWRDRSPLFHAERIKDALILFQGADDIVVPKEQADSMAAVLRRRGVPHEYHVFEGEGHGWRKPETIESFYTLTMKFLKQYVLYA